MGGRKKDNPSQRVTAELCEAYRTALTDKVTGLETKIEKVDGRLWKTLAGVIVGIILTFIGIVVAILC